ncbi:MAG: F0F1 ATP synthase subunit B [Gemmatimonadaceae bacterium]
MRKILTLPLFLLAAPAYASEAPAAKTDLMSPNTGLMFWTLVIFVALCIILAKYAFKPITAAVEAREAALREAIEAAKRDREEAATLLAQHRAKIEEARGEAQRFIAEARAAGEKVKSHMLEETKAQQQEMLDRARREIEAERDRAIAQLRREAVELAISGAEKVIERNLDSEANRKIVETFLASIPASRPDRASR